MSRTISTSLRLEIVDVYYHSNMKKRISVRNMGYPNVHYTVLLIPLLPLRV